MPSDPPAQPSGSPKEGPWVLLDGRAALEPERACALLVGMREECEEARDAGEYGEGCVAMPLKEWAPDV